MAATAYAEAHQLATVGSLPGQAAAAWVSNVFGIAGDVRS